MKFIGGMLITLLLLACAHEARAQRLEGAGRSAGQTLEGLERRTWELIKRRDFGSYAALTADDYYEVWPDGEVHDKASILRFFREDFVLRDYTLTDFKVVMLGAEAGIVVHKADVQGVYKGADEKFRVTAVSGWARRRGKWLNVFHQENYIK